MSEWGDRGTGIVASIAALIVFLGFLFFSVQLLFNLYATSVVTANSYDAARKVASYTANRPGGSVAGAKERAEREMRGHLGSYSERVTFDWSRSTADTVRLHVRASNPKLLFYGSKLLGFDTIDRTVEVRVERAR